LLQKEKEVSKKDLPIAAKEKTMWDTRGEFSDRGRGGKDNGSETTAHFT
jgi:hypothetical protein